ncbi:MAG: helix-turn-helix domain-containing protein [Nitrososphaera sp.]
MADWITTKQAAELSGYNAEYIRDLIRKGKIRSQKWGRDWQISRASLLAYVRTAETSPDKRRGAKKKRS